MQSRALYRLAYRFTGRQFDAEDLLQEFLTRLYSRSERLTKVDILRPWLARALYNLHVDQCRSRARSPFGRLQGSGDEAEERIAAQPNPGGSSEGAAEGLILGQHLAAAVAELPEEQQLIVILHDVEGYEMHEAAAILDVPVGTVKSRLHRAHDRLRGYLQNRNLIPSNIVLRSEPTSLESASQESEESDDGI
jgi:RNA polymerase sigma factor (sigma-70 family)